MRKNNQLFIEDILKILPHRQPFVLIDRVLELTPYADGSRNGRKIKAVKNVSYNEDYFAGHFPHRPVMPGVLIMEAMCQAGAIACYRPTDPPMDVAIGRLGEVRIRRPVVPGDQLVIVGEVTRDRGSTVVVKLVCHVGDELVSELEVLASVTPIQQS